MPVTMTKKAMTGIVRETLRYGHFRRSEWESYVRCLTCRTDVTAHRSATEAHSGVTWSKALTAAMLDHLPACNALQAARTGEDLSRATLDAVDGALGLAPLNGDAYRVLRTEYDARTAR